MAQYSMVWIDGKPVRTPAIGSSDRKAIGASRTTQPVRQPQPHKGPRDRQPSYRTQQPSSQRPPQGSSSNIENATVVWFDANKSFGRVRVNGSTREVLIRVGEFRLFENGSFNRSDAGRYRAPRPKEAVVLIAVATDRGEKAAYWSFAE